MNPDTMKNIAIATIIGVFLLMTLTPVLFIAWEKGVRYGKNSAKSDLVHARLIGLIDGKQAMKQSCEDLISNIKKQ